VSFVVEVHSLVLSAWWSIRKFTEFIALITESACFLLRGIVRDFSWLFCLQRFRCLRFAQVTWTLWKIGHLWSCFMRDKSSAKMFLWPGVYAQSSCTDKIILFTSDIASKRFWPIALSHKGVVVVKHCRWSAACFCRNVNRCHAGPQAWGSWGWGDNRKKFSNTCLVARYKNKLQ